MRYFIEVITIQDGTLFYGANNKRDMEFLIDNLIYYFADTIVVTELGKEIMRIKAA